MTLKLSNSEEEALQRGAMRRPKQPQNEFSNSNEMKICFQVFSSLSPSPPPPSSRRMFVRVLIKMFLGTLRKTLITHAIKGSESFLLGRRGDQININFTAERSALQLSAFDSGGNSRRLQVFPLKISHIIKTGARVSDL